MIGAGKLGRAHDTHAHSRRHRLSTGFAATGWPLTWVVSGLYLGLLVAGLAAPLVGRLIHRRGGRPVLAVSTQVVSNLERGAAIPSIDILCKIARGLGVDPRELFGAGLAGGGRPPSQTSKLVDLLATFDEDLARQALVILKSLSQVRRR